MTWIYLCVHACFKVGSCVCVFLVKGGKQNLMVSDFFLFLFFFCQLSGKVVFYIKKKRRKKR